MNKDLIDFYEAEKLKLEREINDLWEVGKKSLNLMKKKIIV